MVAQLAEATYPYEPTNDGDLTLREGDRLEVHLPTPELIAKFGPFGDGEGWACGTLISTGQQGMFPEAYVKILSSEPSVVTPAALEPATVSTDAPSKTKKKRSLKAAANAAKMAARMAKSVAGGSGSSLGDGVGSCGKCSKGCFVYGPHHPEFPTVGHLEDWSCDVCGAEFVNSEQTLHAYENLYACRTFDSCDWIVCGKSNLARTTSSLQFSCT